VHRDVKPSNLLVDERGTVRILDMGLARIREQLQDEEAAAGRDITTTGQVVGTVEYMAPEQAEDTRQADQRADIYGLGCTLYRLVTGELPYRGETVVQLILAHREQSVPSLRGPRGDVPLEADQVFRKMVAKSPSDRYQTMDEVIAAFERIGFDGRGRSKPREAAGPAGRRGGAVAAGASGGSSSWNTPAEGPEAARRTSASWILLPTVLVLIALAALRATDWHDDEGDSGGLAGGAGGQVDSGAEQAGFAEWAATMGLPLTATNSIGMTLRLIPPGEFLMGGGSEEVAAMRQALEADGAGAGDWALSPIEDELPRHPVRITRPFYIGTHEVTVGEFRVFVADAGYTTEAEKSVQAGAASPADWRHPGGFTQSDRHPVVQVSWRDATAFCQWLSRREGVEYHLPTEAQWEYACRAGGSGAWSFGNDGGLAARHTWFGPNAGQRTHQIGLLEPNAFGLFDMHGNVLEWCLDGARGYTEERAADPLGPGDGPRVVRGGDYAAPNAWCLRSALRIACAGDPSRSIGFRVARRIESSELAGPGTASRVSR
ncbi:MAG: bifunctional serine/threonine-protein kinase/formylglycine-generating enzyme family protein, partial [Pirellulales bacterium]